MFDAYLLLVPLLVLPIVLLFVFVGCSFHPNYLGTLRIFVKFDPPREEKFIPDVNISEIEPLEGTYPTLLINKEVITEPNMPEKIRQFELSGKVDLGNYEISCAIYENEIFGPPVIVKSCNFAFSSEDDTATFVIDSSNNITGCLTAG